MSLYDLVRRATVVCATCETRREDLLQCPCRSVFYCDTACQMEHWPVHKHQCTQMHRGVPTLRRCANCGSASYRLHSCQCRAALYCTAKCQREHWRLHRSGCSCWSFRVERVHSRFHDEGTQADDEDGADDDDDDDELGTFGSVSVSTPGTSRNLLLQRRTASGASVRQAASFRAQQSTGGGGGGGSAAAAEGGEGGTANSFARMLSNVRRSVTEVFFTTAKRHMPTSLICIVEEFATLEQQQRERLAREEEAAQGVLQHHWQGMNVVQYVKLSQEEERRRRLRVLAEYNLWAKQQAQHIPWRGKKQKAAGGT